MAQGTKGIWIFFISGAALAALGFLFMFQSPYPLVAGDEYQRVRGDIIISYPITERPEIEDFDSIPKVFIVSVFRDKSESYEAHFTYSDTLQGIISGASQEDITEWEITGVPLITNAGSPRLLALDDWWENLWPGLTLFIIGAGIIFLGFSVRKLLIRLDS